MNDGMEQAQRLTQVRGAAAVGVYIRSFLFLSFPLLVFSSFLLFSISQLSYISGDEG
jgi:hypothetical protein